MFVYDQPQKLCKNTYECKHTVSFAVGDRRGDNAFFQPQMVECHFMGWAETATGKIEGMINTSSIKSEEITALARPEKPGWRDDVIAYGSQCKMQSIIFCNF